MTDHTSELIRAIQDLQTVFRRMGHSLDLAEIRLKPAIGANGKPNGYERHEFEAAMQKSDIWRARYRMDPAPARTPPNQLAEIAGVKITVAPRVV